MPFAGKFLYFSFSFFLITCYYLEICLQDTEGSERWLCNVLCRSKDVCWPSPLQVWILLSLSFLTLYCFVKTALNWIMIRGHKKQDDYCQTNTNPHNFPELGPVNSVVCEQTFSYTNHYTNLKVMNGPRYNFFWVYILDLHNHYVEDHRVLKLHPLSSVRMDTILESLLSNSVKKMSI